MTNSTGKRIAITLASCLCLSGIVAQSSSAQSGDNHLVGDHFAPEDAQVVAAPALAPNRAAWVTVLDGGRKALPKTALYVNGVPYDTNAYGQAAFVVPNTGAVSIYLKSADGKEIARQQYALQPDGLLSTPAAASVVQQLIAEDTSIPTLDYAPLYVSPGQTFAVLGHQFEGKPQGDRVIIDGLTAELLAGSANALVGRAPVNLAVGPLKLVFVATKSGDTPAFETDVVKTFVEVPDSGESRSQSLSGRVVAYGTSYPMLVALQGASAGDVCIVSEGQPPVQPNNGVLVLPGGTPNFQPIDVKRKSKGSVELNAQAIADVPQLYAGLRPADEPLVAPTATTFAALDYAALVKLKRRALAIDSKLFEARTLSAVPGRTGADRDRVQSELQALSARHQALAAMLSARKKILIADGGSDVTYQKALDDAAGGAYYVLESTLRDVKLVGDRPSTQVAVVQRVPAMPAPIVIPDVKFKLWPPLSSLTSLPPPAAPVATVAPIPAKINSLTPPPSTDKPVTTDTSAAKKPLVKSTASKSSAKPEPAKIKRGSSRRSKVVSHRRASTSVHRRHRHHR